MGLRFPPDTEEKQKNVGAFFSNPDNAPQAIAAALPELVKTFQAANPSIKSWGLIGVSSQMTVHFLTCSLTEDSELVLLGR